MLIHFKVEVCATIDVEALVDTIFGENKHLVVLHKGKHENPHYHFQGETDLAKQDLQKVYQDIAAGHSKKISNPKSRPLKSAKKGIDEKGYQYMMKEGVDSVRHSRGFSDEELEQLAIDSKEYVESLKAGLYEYLQDFEWKPKSKDAREQPGEIHDMLRGKALDYYLEEDKMPPPNFQKLILYYMAKMAKSRVDGQLYKWYRMYVYKKL